MSEVEWMDKTNAQMFEKTNPVKGSFYGTDKFLPGNGTITVTNRDVSWYTEIHFHEAELLYRAWLKRNDFPDCEKNGDTFLNKHVYDEFVRYKKEQEDG